MPVHGVEIERLTGGVRPVEVAAGGAIGVLAVCSELTEGDMVLLRTADDITAADDGSGTLVPIMNSIRSHTGAPVVCIAIDLANIADAAGDAATFTRAFRFLQAQAELGIKPVLLAQCLIGNVGSDLQAIAARMGGVRVFQDGPNDTDAAAIADIGSYDSQRAMYCDPAFIDTQDNVVGLSVLYAAVASTLNFWQSVSNQAVQGVKSLTRTVGFEMGDATSQAQLLNDAKINTLIREDGWRLWGGLATSSDPLFKFAVIGHTDDVIVQALKTSFLWAVDKGITATFIDDLQNSVDAFLRGLKAQDSIIGAAVWIDKDLNTPESIALGNLIYDYDFTGIYPAHHIKGRRHMTVKYLEDLVA